MVKNNKIVVKVAKETLDNFDSKCYDLRLTRTQFIEKIANEDIVFLDNNSKKLIKLLIPQETKVTH